MRYLNIGPPRPNICVNIQIAQLGDYESFCLYNLGLKHFGRFDKSHMTELIRQYAKDHESLISNAVVPNKFMIAVTTDAVLSAETQNINAVPQNDETKWSAHNDLIRAIAVVGRVAGNLYVPTRKIIINEEKLGKQYKFLVREMK